MPLYEYECDACGKRFEVRQNVGEDGSHLKCPRCETPSPRRVFSTFACTGTEVPALSGGGACSTCGSGNCASCGI
ncbi:MAG TPA: zinc ribbon domain-containing protein [Dehalococcoidia bacterium]|nr:zinc ribbon domain-containing protein [Dehalococcoidia bacterium]